jgi:hypothetical protein
MEAVCFSEVWITASTVSPPILNIHLCWNLISYEVNRNSPLPALQICSEMSSRGSGAHGGSGTYQNLGPLRSSGEKGIIVSSFIHSFIDLPKSPMDNWFHHPNAAYLFLPSFLRTLFCNMFWPYTAILGHRA